MIRYDQAQLLSTSLDLSLLLPPSSPHLAILRAFATDIIEYTSRDLQSKEGGFYSAEDADSYPTKSSTQKREGAFYVWTAQELDEILGKEDAEVFGFHYGAKLGGNVDPSVDREGHLTGQVRSIRCRLYTDVMTGLRYRTCCIQLTHSKKLLLSSSAVPPRTLE